MNPIPLLHLCMEVNQYTDQETFRAIIISHVKVSPGHCKHEPNTFAPFMYQPSTPFSFQDFSFPWCFFYRGVFYPVQVVVIC